MLDFATSSRAYRDDASCLRANPVDVTTVPKSVRTQRRQEQCDGREARAGTDPTTGFGKAAGGGEMSVVVHPGRLRQEMTRRGWNASDLARESHLSQATISAALAGRSIAAGSLALIARALSRVPANGVIDSLIMNDGYEAELG